MNRPLFAIAVVTCLPSLVLAEEQDAVEDDSKRCLNARSIRGADVIDDNHVVFEIQGRRLFLNSLPKSCVGLSRDRRFSYDTYTRSLCARDKIRILKEAGNALYESKACSLGRFQPISVEDLQLFIDERTAAPKPGSEKAKSAAVEEVVTE